MMVVRDSKGRFCGDPVHPFNAKEYARKWYRENREKSNARSRLYYLKHREEILRRMKLDREAFPEKHKERKRRDYVLHREARLAKSAEARRLHVKYGGEEYVGVCMCPKCGRKGYKVYCRLFNTATGHFYAWHTHVKHFRPSGFRHSLYDGHCYVGVGKL